MIATASAPKKTFESPWEHFTKQSKEIAICNICRGNKQISTSNYSKKGMIVHLQSIHGMIMIVKTASTTSPGNVASGSQAQPDPVKKQRRIDDFVTQQKPTIGATLAELVSKDGMSLHMITSSRILKSIQLQEISISEWFLFRRLALLRRFSN